MAVNLNPGADSALVQQAYRMGMAGVPKDLSGTFEYVGKSYSKAMEAVGEAGAQAFQTIGAIAAPMIKEAQEFNKKQREIYAMPDSWKNAFLGTGDDPGALANLKDMKKAFRKAPWGSNERKELRGLFEKEQAKVFGALEEYQSEAFKNAGEIAIGNMNPHATGAQNSIMQRAIMAGGEPLKGEAGDTYTGMYSGITKNADGDFAFTLFDKDGTQISSVNDDGSYTIYVEGVYEPISISTSQLGDLIVTKDMDARIAANQIGLDQIALGKTGANYDSASARMQLDNVFQTPNQVADGMHYNYGGKDAYADALLKPNQWTAEMYGSIQNLDASWDVDGKDGVDKKDFIGEAGSEAAINLVRLRKEMLNQNNPQAKMLFIDWFEDTHVKGRYDEGNRLYRGSIEKSNKTNWSGLQDNKSYQVGGQWAKGLDLTSDAAQIQRLANGDADVFTSWNNKEVEFDGVNWVLDGEPSSKNGVVNAILGSKVPSMFEKTKKKENVVLLGEEEPKDEKSWYEFWK